MQDCVSSLAKFCSDDWLHTVWFHDWVERITTHDIIKYSIDQFMFQILPFCCHCDKLQIVDACSVIFSL